MDAMTRAGHRRSIPLFIGVGTVLVALAVALNIGWVVISWREGLLLAAGIVVTLLIIAGVVLNTAFLVREIRRNEQQDGFLNAVTHELKTPVASIRLYLETLRSRDVDPATREQFYRIMLEDTDRLQATIEQVLRAGVATSSNRAQRYQHCNLRDIAVESVELCRTRHQLTEQQLRFEYLCGQQVGSVVKCDAEEIRAAMRNLLENAVKYSGGKVNIMVTVCNAGSAKVLFRVSDDGVGISARELKRVFKRFYRIPAPASLRVKGTGLGLYIVWSVAKRHGGRVYAESDGPGCGSVFTLELPVADSGEVEEGETQQRQLAERSEEVGPGPAPGSAGPGTSPSETKEGIGQRG